METLLSKIKRIHLVGIGGAGMSALAILLKEKGFILSGSDIKESAYLKKLKEEGIKIFLGHRKKNLEKAELVCVSSAIKADNVEVKEAEKRGIPVLKRAELLSLLALNKRVIAVGGAHGKTTTTAFLAYLLESLGYKPSVFVGGELINYARSAWWGGDFFVIETDESDGSFLKIIPSVAIITNIDKEHLDFYKEEKTLIEKFSQFASSAKEITIGWGDSPFLRNILKNISNSLSYGFSPDNDIQAKNIILTPQATIFDLKVKEKEFKRIRISLLGEHNLLNTLACLAFFYYLGEDLNRVIDKLEDFKSTKRRFQIKKIVKNVMFVDDYAHHPTEIEATLKTAKLFNPKRLVVIFEPHRFSRIKLLQDKFLNCFSLADVLIVTDIYSASEEKPQDFDEYAFFHSLKISFNKEFFYFPKDTLIEKVVSLLEENDLVIGLGAGDISLLLDGIIEKFERFRNKE